MDLEVFHHLDRSPKFYRYWDRRNKRTGNICYYYELTGWYDINIAMRLLGHHRLFQLRKNLYGRSESCLSPAFGYILHYRENGIVKDTWIGLIRRLLRVVRIEYPEIKNFNRTLLFNHPEILESFLIAAETDFDKALHDAMEQIRRPAFLSEAQHADIHLELTENHQHNNSFSKNELHIHPEITKEAPIPNPAKGKEEGVFSKKQILILLDLLAKAKLIDPIDLRKHNKFPAIAQLLRAITGRGEDTWVNELEKYQTKGLYEWTSNGQKDELIRILTNLAEKFGDAGINSIARLADQKIRDLRSERR